MMERYKSETNPSNFVDQAPATTSLQPSPSPTLNLSPLQTFTANLNLSQTAQTKPTLLYFTAKWCAICESVESQISKQIDLFSSSKTVVFVDLDQFAYLAQSYQVVNPDTWVQLDEQANSTAKWSGNTNAALAP